MIFFVVSNHVCEDFRCFALSQFTHAISERYYRHNCINARPRLLLRFILLLSSMLVGKY